MYFQHNSQDNPLKIYKIDNVTQNLPVASHLNQKNPTVANEILPDLHLFPTLICSHLLPRCSSLQPHCTAAGPQTHRAGSQRSPEPLPQHILAAHSLTSFKSPHKHHPPGTPQFKCLALFFCITFFIFCIIQYYVYMIHIASVTHLSYLLPISSTQNGSSKKTWHTGGTLNHCGTDS